MNRSGFKSLLYTLAELVACVLLLPFFILWKTSLFRYMTFTTTLSLLPSKLGIVIRRAWYRRTLKHCGDNLIVDFLAWIRTNKTQVGDNVYIGHGSYVGLAELGSNIMVSAQVIVMSGRHQHRTDRLDTPMNKSGGGDTLVRVGDDVWIGAGAIVGADLADGCVVGAGAVVVKPVNAYEVVAGVPAKCIKMRNSTESGQE